MIGFHCTTPKKLERYMATKGILPPVRFWIFKNSAKAWMEKTGRSILLQIECEKYFPLPDHHPRGHAFWTPNIIVKFSQIE